MAKYLEILSVEDSTPRYFLGMKLSLKFFRDSVQEENGDSLWLIKYSAQI